MRIFRRFALSDVVYDGWFPEVVSLHVIIILWYILGV